MSPLEALVIGPGDPFPPFEKALRQEQGWLCAISQALTAGMLERAYRQGIFPWYSQGEPVLWWFTEPRLVLPTGRVAVSHSLRRTLHRAARGLFGPSECEIRFDDRFEDVMRACAGAKRAGQSGTWITEDIIAAYCGLHARGLAHCVTVLAGGQPAGGLYGVALGRMFFGESMFCLQANASKVALCALAAFLKRQGGELIDCQQVTRHLASMGGITMGRAEFLGCVERLASQPGMDWAGAARGPANGLLA